MKKIDMLTNRVYITGSILLLSSILGAQIFQVTRNTLFNHSSPVATYRVDGKRCTAPTSQKLIPLLRPVLEKQGLTEQSSSLHTININDDIYVIMNTDVPSQSLFEDMGAVISNSLNCSSQWCEGKGDLSTYSEKSRELIARRERGEKVTLPGCERQGNDFKFIGWEEKKLKQSIRSLDILSIVVNFTAFIFFTNTLRKNQNTSAS